MNISEIKYLLISFIISIILNNIIFNSGYAAPADIRLYALDCGYIDIPDGSMFFNKGFYPHKPLHLADPCFLIKHPKGWLLWDLGLGDQYLGKTIDDTQHGIKFSVPVSLVSQLKQLGLAPKDIKFVAISHAHFDHTGNANLFPQATWIMQNKEYEFMQQEPLSSAVSSNTFKFLKPANKVLLKGNYDVFGDNSVKILSTPGHTPGHESLEVTLPHQGVIILSGDLFHTRQSYLFKQVPSFNIDRNQTFASMDQINDLLNKTKGRLIVQHDVKDFQSLPKFPGYLN